MGHGSELSWCGWAFKLGEVAWLLCRRWWTWDPTAFGLWIHAKPKRWVPLIPSLTHSPCLGSKAENRSRCSSWFNIPAWTNGVSGNVITLLHYDLNWSHWSLFTDFDLYCFLQIIFRDFKSSNILLDEDWKAKLSDFGLARLGPSEGLTHVTTDVSSLHSLF